MTCIRKLTTCLDSALLVAGLLLAASRPLPGECRPTPELAVESSLGRAPAEVIAAAPGSSFEVWRTEEDPALGRRWVWIRTCGGAGPAFLAWVPLSPAARLAQSASAAPVDPLVRSGDGVVVLESEDAISMRLSGRAIEAGALGDKIRVRITAVPNGAIVAGVVSGKDEVKLND